MNTSRRGFFSVLAAAVVGRPSLAAIESRIQLAFYADVAHMVLGVDRAIAGSDSTAVWLVSWGEDGTTLLKERAVWPF